MAVNFAFEDWEVVGQDRIPREERLANYVHALLDDLRSLTNPTLLHTITAARRLRLDQHDTTIRVTDKDTWDRLPDCLITALGGTLPESALSDVLNNRHHKFGIHSILRATRVLDDSLVMTILERQQTDELAFWLFSYLGPSLEKAVLQDSLESYRTIMSGLVMAHHLRRLEIFGPIHPEATIIALEKFFADKVMQSVKQFVVGEFGNWTYSELDALKSVLIHLAPNLGSLSLRRLSPLRLNDEAIRLSHLQSLKVQLTTEVDVNLFYRYLIKVIDLDRLTSFSISTYIPYNNRPTTFLFRAIGRMRSLKKLNLAIRLQDLVAPNAWPLIRQTLIEEANSQLRNLFQLEVLQLSVDAARGVAQEVLLDYRNWLALFQMRVPTIRKLILEAPSRMDFTYFQFDFRYRPLPQLERLVLIYSRSTSMAKKKPEKLFENCISAVPDIRAMAKWTGLKVLTLVDIGILTASMLANIAELFPALLELNISAASKEVYHRPLLGALYRAFDFDSEMAATLSKLPSLRALRFTDDFPKPCYKILDAMVKRALALPEPRPGGSKKLLLRVPLNEPKTREMLKKSNRKWEKVLEGVDKRLQVF